jgi:hypothetical protein
MSPEGRREVERLVDELHDADPAERGRIFEEAYRRAGGARRPHRTFDDK